MKRLVWTGLALALVPALFAGAQEGEGIAEDLSVYRDPDRLLALIESPPDGFYLVDTRTFDEYVSGHIPGAIHRDYREIGGDLPTEDRDAVIFVYCLSGVRSNRAARTLRRLGFTRVLNWGGILDWPHEVGTGSSP